MGQPWTIFNIDKGSCIDYLEKYGEFFTNGRTAACHIATLLSSAGVKFPKDPLDGQPYTELRKYKSSKTGICDLPCELHYAIFAELRDPVDVVAFYITASHFWRVGLPHYKALFTEHVRQTYDWSGDSLICMGRYAKDWPEGLITDEWYESRKASYISHDGREPYRICDLLLMFSQDLCDRQKEWPKFEFDHRCQLTKWNRLSRERQQRFRKFKSAAFEEDDGPTNDLPEFLPMYKYDFSPWLRLYTTRRVYALGNGEPVVLRNLSKKVYVRQDALALKSDNDASVHYMSFGSLVLARIAWSNDSSMAMEYATNHDLHRGVWAGDRFDTASVDDVEHDDQWTDVSAAARKELEEIWESEFGSNWQDFVRKRRL
ncbi:hypothetical protein CPB85DRAFT_1432131 [Mucidula mucida]|nr:hypothetical protein CPB85DRAFT_1432131 [Mucidula mucida]